MMKVYVFGNQDEEKDGVAVRAARRLEDVEVVLVKSNEDVPFVGEELVVIMDAVEGIDKVTVFDEGDLEKLVLPPRTSAHDYDLGFQLRYLKKIGKLKRVRIVGLSMSGEVKIKELAAVLASLGKEAVS